MPVCEAAGAYKSSTVRGLRGSVALKSAETQNRQLWCSNVSTSSDSNFGMKHVRLLSDPVVTIKIKQRRGDGVTGQSESGLNFVNISSVIPLFPLWHKTYI